MSVFSQVPQNFILTSGANSALTWTNAVSVSSMNVSSLGASNLSVSTLTTSTSVSASSLVTSSITANSVGYSTLSGSTINATRLNYSSIVGSSISSNAMTLSLTNVSTQNTQIYQVATTNPTTSYTAIQASHVSTGTTNNALVLNPGGGNVGVGDTAPSQLLSLFGTGTPAMLIKSNSGGTSGNTASINLSNAAYNMGTIQAIENANGYGGIWGSELTFATNYNNTMTERMRITARGNVGIGTTAPVAKLHVATVDGSVTMPLSFINQNGYGIYANSGSVAARGNTLDFASNDYNGGSVVARNVMTLRPEGYVGIGTTAPAAPLEVRGATAGDMFTVYFSNGSKSAAIIGGTTTSNGGWGSSLSVLYVARDTTNSRSVNAAGTFNASGADYAEYMTKDSDFPALKGDILGVLPSGKLTNQFDTAIHFLLKSTNPCMVGGDVWGTEATVGEKPKDLTESATEEEKAAHAAVLAAWEARLEAERQKVDRMAFAGQVPVNIQGTTPGDYIIPSRNADGTIGVAAVSSAAMTFAQYQSAVGRVISILADGRANVVVKAV